MRVSELYRLIVVEADSKRLKSKGFYTSKREAMNQYEEVKKEVENKGIESLINLEIVNLNWLEKENDGDLDKVTTKVILGKMDKLKVIDVEDIELI